MGWMQNAPPHVFNEKPKMAKRYRELRFESREEWLKAREDGIGSSEVGAILGVHPWQSAYRVWKRKVGLETEQMEESEQMEKGHIYEPYCSEVFEETTGMKVIKSSEGDWIAVDPERPYLRVSVDRTCWLKGKKHNESGKGIVECKTSDKDIQPEDLYATMDESGNAGPGKVTYWRMQVMYQQYVLGYHTAYLQFVNRLRPKTCRWTEELTFDEESWNALILPLLDAFWNERVIPAREALGRGADPQWVIEQYAPSVETSEDARDKYQKAEPGSTVEADEMCMGYVEALKEVTAKRKDLEKQEDYLKGKIMAEMGSMETLTYQGKVVATNKNANPSVKFDHRRFLEEHADACADYMTETAGTRRFLIK